jgi:hypothetical protein
MYIAKKLWYKQIIVSDAADGLRIPGVVGMARTTNHLP